MSTIDPLSDVLHLLAAHSYVTIGQRAGADWAIRYDGFVGMKFLALRKGQLWFRLEAEQRWQQLMPGDGIILTRFAPFVLATDPSMAAVPLAEVDYVIKEGFADLGGDDSVILSGKMEVDQLASAWLLDLLPEVIFIAHGSDVSSTLNWLMASLHKEIQQPRPGSVLAGNHLMQLIMIEGIRSWLTSEEAGLSGWLAALQDSRVLKALGAIHTDPSRNWQLTELASIAGMSRTGFARLFLQSTGTSAIQYLTQWKMRLASRALRLSNEPIKHLAYSLGYASESTFSTVFKRVYGISPSEHRRAYRQEPSSALLTQLTSIATGSFT
ncbi:AraC family transcriptional regulator [Shewanella sp. C32]|uniref:AraC family transcriptional regulator n=1 Tax=Shewanella electrica TaxID=515560 RepID=A0ABT2FIF4_9GAMM|nr:AraC family transcriptional regulator [Shewanella electrica]MCH1924212.1 AraC family transcriptional regulator [Shewanella electrica]MCS4556115.1 AraC family transcriptional regulator [Shewanella electrica]